MNQEFKYTVCTRCFTYNHAPYIVDAMNGFAIQKTNFPVISLIIDDASTDGESEVIRRYLSDNFQTPFLEVETDDYHLVCANHKINDNCSFAVFVLKYNHYCIKKSKFTYLADWLDNSKYHAICEGDDYWIDPLKLQKQVDYLENHPDVGMCYTNFNILTESTGKLQESVLTTCPHEYSYDYTLGDWIRKKDKCYVGPMTWVVKKDSWQSIPQIPGAVDGTFSFFAYYKYSSKTNCLLNETTAVYRINRGSMSQATTIENSFKRVKGLYLQQLALAEKYLESDKDYSIECIKRSYYTRYFKMIYLFEDEEERAIVKEYKKLLSNKNRFLLKICNNPNALSLYRYFYRRYYINRKGLDK